mmetsp:Transcript_24626/g.53101  ORF Transcript_24626/g.53101 Transcript_24626/m.53101 type:complete len:212 (+) Transcript_24626:182-817(+)
MATPTSFLRVANRTLQNSSRGLTTGGRICSVGSHATIGDKFSCSVRSHGMYRHMTIATYSTQPAAQQMVMVKKCHNLKGEHKRYFSFKSKKKHDDSDIDRSKFTHEVKVSMPDMGDSDLGGDDADALGVVDKWYKEEGDIIKRDDVICDIRTKVFTFGMMTDDDYDSIMGKILIPEESDPVKPGTVICITLNEGHGEETKTKEDDEKLVLE